MPKIIKKTTVRKQPGEPLRIIIEIVINDGSQKKEMFSLAGGEEKPVIEYEFTTNKITLINLSLDDESVVNPKVSGEVKLDYIDPSGTIAVSAYATGTGSGSLQLKYKGKYLQDMPLDFKFNGQNGFINATVKV